MQVEHISYLKSINIPSTLMDIIQAFFFRQSALFEPIGEKIEDIFISEYISDGRRRYEGVWLFSKRISMMLRLYTDDQDTLINRMQKNIFFINIKSENYDFEKGNENSKLNIVYVAYGNNIGNLKATDENCDHLMYLCKKYFLPNFLVPDNMEANVHME